MADYRMPMESAEDTLKRIFADGDSSVGMEIAQESSRYARLEQETFPKPAKTRRFEKPKHNNQPFKVSTKTKMP